MANSLRTFLACVILIANVAPSIAQTQVPIQRSPAAAANTVNAQPDKAVVSKGMVANSATVTVPASDQPQTVTIDTKPFIEDLLTNVIYPAVSAIVAALVGVIVIKINSWAKANGVQNIVKIDDSMRDALITSIRSVAAGGIAQGVVKVEGTGRITLPDGVLARMAKEVVEQRARDAVQHFGLSPADVEKRVLEQMALILPAGASST